MQYDPAQKNPSADATLLKEAIEFHRAGSLDIAAARYATFLSQYPGHEWANVLAGLLALDQKNPEKALDLLRRGLHANPMNETAALGLGNALLTQRHWQEAEKAFRRVLEITPQEVVAHRHLGLALKNQKRLKEAIRHFRDALALQRQYPSPAKTCTEQRTSGIKIQHDIDQLTYLSGRLPERPDLLEARESLNQLLRRRPDILQDHFSLRPLLAQDQAAIGWFYNRLMHEPERASCRAAIENRARLEQASNDLLREETSFVVLDGFLTSEALVELQKFCFESTFWFDVKDHGGHVGAYIDEGFDHELIFQVAEELQQSMPEVFRDLALTQAWGFKYDNRGEGTKVHADQARLTLNLWISPEDANLGGLGGLEVFNVSTPPEWDFQAYNASPQKIASFLAQSNAVSTVIPYKENRAVLFKSSHFHRTDRFAFKPGYTDRRINISFLFGKVS